MALSSYGPDGGIVRTAATKQWPEKKNAAYSKRIVMAYVIAYVVMDYTLMAYVFMPCIRGLYSYGLYSYGLTLLPGSMRLH